MGNNKTKKCSLCGKMMSHFYKETFCYDCFRDGMYPDIELAFNYHIQGHSLECALDMSDGLVCGCENSI